MFSDSAGCQTADRMEGRSANLTESKRVAIQSDRYGELLVNEDQIYRFDKGIVGWQNLHEYALIPLEEMPFYMLHATEGSVSFFLIPAEQVVEDYGFRIDEDTVQLLGASQPDEVSTMLIVNIIDNQLFVNLKAPVLLSPKCRAGVQFIIHDMDYPLRYPLHPESEGVG